MGFFNMDVPSFILIIAIALIIFGPKKLPELGKATGETLKEFKSATNEIIHENEEEIKEK